VIEISWKKLLFISYFSKKVIKFNQISNISTVFTQKRQQFDQKAKIFKENSLKHESVEIGLGKGDACTTQNIGHVRGNRTKINQNRSQNEEIHSPLVKLS